MTIGMKIFSRHNYIQSTQWTKVVLWFGVRFVRFFIIFELPTDEKGSQRLPTGERIVIRYNMVDKNKIFRHKEKLQIEVQTDVWIVFSVHEGVVVELMLFDSLFVRDLFGLSTPLAV